MPDIDQDGSPSEDDRDGSPGETDQAASLTRLAHLVTKAYEDADNDLRRAVRESLRTGIPASVLNVDPSPPSNG